MISDKDLTCVNSAKDIGPWLDKMPELAIIAAIEPVFICSEKDPLPGPVLWKQLSAEIFKRLNSYDGFVVTGSTSSVLDNALAVSFALNNLNKPVVFTGSQLPALNKDLLEGKNLGLLGLKPNLINALQVATMDFGAVGLVYGSRCLRAVKARQVGIYLPDIFESADNGYFAKIDFSISLVEKFTPSEEPPILKNNFSAKVLLLDYYPGFDVSLLKKTLEGYQGLMVQYAALKKMPKSLVDNLSKLKIPVALYNRFYVSELNQENIIEVFGLTKGAALHKFIWALGQATQLSEIRSLMNNEICHEFLHDYE